MKAGIKLRNDPLFYVALLAAPVVWLVLYLILQPDTDRLWPLHHLDKVFFAVMFAPVFEEILFRGLIQEFIRDYFTEKSLGPITIANITTSFLFVIAHIIINGGPLLWNTLVFFPSLVFGHFKDRTGKLTAPVILHAFYNAGFLWVFSASG